MQVNILLTAPYTTPSDEQFKQASSFQESPEAELKTYYKMKDACRQPEYLEELLALLTSYYEGVLGMAGASGVTAPRALALSCTPKKPHTPEDPGGPAGGPRRRGGRLVGWVCRRGVCRRVGLLGSAR